MNRTTIRLMCILVFAIALSGCVAKGSAQNPAHVRSSPFSIPIADGLIVFTRVPESKQKIGVYAEFEADLDLPEWNEPYYLYVYPSPNLYRFPYRCSGDGPLPSRKRGVILRCKPQGIAPEPRPDLDLPGGGPIGQWRLQVRNTYGWTDEYDFNYNILWTDR
jgi:hypothetical protein